MRTIRSRPSSRMTGGTTAPGPERRRANGYNDGMDALILFSHGSLLCGAGEALEAHAARLRARGRWPVVEVGYMNYSEPTFAQAIEGAGPAGATRSSSSRSFWCPATSSPSPCRNTSPRRRRVPRPDVHRHGRHRLRRRAWPTRLIDAAQHPLGPANGGTT